MNWKLALATWITMFLASLALAPKAFGKKPSVYDNWPDAVFKYNCGGRNDHGTVWKIASCSDKRFITIDCDGNIWWLKTSGTNKTSSVIEEQILYTAERYKKATNIMKKTIKDNKLVVKEWFNK